MINSELGHVKTLAEFNSEIRRQQEEAHGSNYCDIHDAIKRFLTSNDAYMELGTHQGGTASSAMLCNPAKVVLVDIDLSRYRKFLEPIANEYCASNNIELKTIGADSTSLATFNMTDVLVIDSLHNPQHMNKELNFHGLNTKKYIIAHDTSIINGMPNDSLFKCMEAYASRNGWQIIERGTTNVGYTVMKRVV